MSGIGTLLPCIGSQAHTLYVTIKVNPRQEEEAPERTWEQAADEALTRICWSTPYVSEDERMERIYSEIKHMKSSVNSDDFSDVVLIGQMNRLGLAAYAAWMALPGTTLHQFLQTLAEKQAGYGPDNILAFGLAGIHVRMSDKAARLQNLTAHNRDTDEFSHVQELLADTLMDLAGYAVVANMLHYGTFTLPLERDLPSVDEQNEQQLGSLFLELGQKMRDHFTD